MAKGKRTNRPPTMGKPGTGGGQQLRGTQTGATATQATQATGSGNGSGMPDLAKRPTSTASTSASAGASAGARPVRPVARQEPPRRRSQQAWWQTRWGTIATFVSIALVIALFFWMANRSGGGSSTDGQAVPPEVLAQITQVSPEVSAAVGTGGLRSPLMQVKPQVEVLKGPSGKPQIVYIGADYCPFCAAERWSVIVAMSRFGTFSNLHYTTSSSSDVYPDTSTFSFYKSSYTSQYIDFVGVEYQDRNQNSLQPLTSEQQALLDKYDAPPYVSQQSAGAIPFMTFGNQYLTSGAGYKPDVLTNQSQAQIAKALSDPKAASTQGIVGNANYLTAAVCQVINDSAPACKVAPIPTIEQQLPKNG